MTPRRLEPILGDLYEQRANGRSRTWYWSQVAAAFLSACVRSHSLRAVAVALALALSLFVGRMAFPLLLGMAFTSFGMWRFHRTSLVVLYIIAVAMVLPDWRSAEPAMLTAGDRVFWSIASVLAGYGVVGVLLVPF